MRPLDPLSSIKIKLGVVIVASVAVTAVGHTLGLRAGMPLAIVAIGSGALSLLMVQFLAHGMTSPLREMVAAAKNMARGDYSSRVTATSRDEVGELARAFNTMASELAEVDRMRRDLVANVSHELRTPISALQAMLENLIDGVDSPDPQIFGTMLEQVQRLGRLVNQLLDLSRLESGAVPLQRSIFPVADLLEQAAREARMHSQDVELEVVVTPQDLTADADPERIHQVLANLIENAIRHSPAGALVTVSAHRSDFGLTLAVADQGPGIPPADASRVFERFYRSDAARSSTQGGTGLGLAIARWIVELHQGSIKVDTGASNGCRMVVELPA